MNKKIPKDYGVNIVPWFMLIVISMLLSIIIYFWVKPFIQPSELEKWVRVEAQVGGSPAGKANIAIRNNSAKETKVYKNGISWQYKGQSYFASDFINSTEKVSYSSIYIMINPNNPSEYFAPSYRNNFGLFSIISF